MSEQGRVGACVLSDARRLSAGLSCFHCVRTGSQHIFHESRGAEKAPERGAGNRRHFDFIDLFLIHALWAGPSQSVSQLTQCGSGRVKFLESILCLCGWCERETHPSGANKQDVVD